MGNTEVRITTYGDPTGSNVVTIGRLQIGADYVFTAINSMERAAESLITSRIQESDLISRVYWANVEANPLHARLSRSSSQLTLELSGVHVSFSAKAVPDGGLESIFCPSVSFDYELSGLALMSSYNTTNGRIEDTRITYAHGNAYNVDCSGALGVIGNWFDNLTDAVDDAVRDEIEDAIEGFEQIGNARTLLSLDQIAVNLGSLGTVLGQLLNPLLPIGVEVDAEVHERSSTNQISVGLRAQTPDAVILTGVSRRYSPPSSARWSEVSLGALEVHYNITVASPSGVTARAFVSSRGSNSTDVVVSGTTSSGLWSKPSYFRHQPPRCPLSDDCPPTEPL